MHTLIVVGKVLFGVYKTDEQIKQYTNGSYHKRKEKTGQEYPMFNTMHNSIFFDPDAGQ